MGKETAIQWCDSTVNPTMGCDGCELWVEGNRTCYAGRLHAKYNGQHRGYAKSFDVIEKFPGRMQEATRWGDLRGTIRPEKPWMNGLPRTIFVSDMSDALSKEIGFEYLRDEIIAAATSEKGSRHEWLWLTKRPGRMVDFAAWLRSEGLSWPENLWAMTSVTGPQSLARVKDLVAVPAAIRGVSFEPLYAEPDWSRIPWMMIHWAIFGGESGPGAHRFVVEWAERGVEAARAAGVAPFVKQLGARVALVVRGQEVQFRDSHGGDWSEWPDSLRVREMPRVRIRGERPPMWETARG